MLQLLPDWLLFLDQYQEGGIRRHISGLGNESDGGGETDTETDTVTMTENGSFNDGAGYTGTFHTSDFSSDGGGESDTLNDSDNGTNSSATDGGSLRAESTQLLPFSSTINQSSWSLAP